MFNPASFICLKSVSLYIDSQWSVNFSASLAPSFHKSGIHQLEDRSTFRQTEGLH